jgi:integrase
MNRIEQFFSESNFAGRTKYNKRIFLDYCFNFFKSLNTPSDFLKIRPSDYLKLYIEIDKLDVLEIVKKRYRYALKNYADFLCRDIYANNKNPELNYDFILSNRFYKFRDGGKPREEHFIEFQDLLELIKWAKFTQPPYIYFAIVVLITSGCRIEGALTLTKSNVDLEKRRFMMFEKSRDRGSKIKYYIINKEIIPTFKQFLDYIPDSSAILFPISQQKFNKHLKHYKPYFHAQLFRDAFNSFLEELGVEESIRDIFQNRTPKSVNAQSYLKKYGDWEKRLQKYDAVFPHLQNAI